MAQKGDSSTDIINSAYDYSYGENVILVERYVDSARIVWKGREDMYGKSLGLVKIINLSSNKLTGKLPSQISSLLLLVGLDVSKNNLIGEIPQMIGKLKNLEALNLSSNHFSGEIPSSMSELTFLNHLDLSDNHLLETRVFVGLHFHRSVGQVNKHQTKVKLVKNMEMSFGNGFMSQQDLVLL